VNGDEPASAVILYGDMLKDDESSNWYVVVIATITNHGVSPNFFVTLQRS
jgi:hypothetical protein